MFLKFTQWYHVNSYKVISSTVKSSSVNWSTSYLRACARKNDLLLKKPSQLYNFHGYTIWNKVCNSQRGPHGTVEELLLPKKPSWVLFSIQLSQKTANSAKDIVNKPEKYKIFNKEHSWWHFYLTSLRHQCLVPIFIVSWDAPSC